MRFVAPLLLAALTAMIGCGDEESTPVAADLPTGYGELSGLCPVPEASREWNEKLTTEARRTAEALIREVRRNPDGQVELVSADAHTGEKYREPMTVRELAEEHLDNPGARGAPCARLLMAELQAAVDGRPAPRDVKDERVYLIPEIEAALELRKDGAAYHGPSGCLIDFIYASRSELEPVLRDGAAANHELVTDPEQTVGLEVYRPTAECRRELERQLAALAR